MVLNATLEFREVLALFQVILVLGSILNPKDLSYSIHTEKRILFIITVLPDIFPGYIVRLYSVSHNSVKFCATTSEMP